MNLNEKKLQEKMLQEENARKDREKERILAKTIIDLGEKEYETIFGEVVKQREYTTYPYDIVEIRGSLDVPIHESEILVHRVNSDLKLDTYADYHKEMNVDMGYECCIVLDRNNEYSIIFLEIEDIDEYDLGVRHQYIDELREGTYTYVGMGRIREIREFYGIVRMLERLHREGRL